jgi:cleavage and polyadenylation specificity factor subunit 3
MMNKKIQEQMKFENPFVFKTAKFVSVRLNGRGKCSNPTTLPFKGTNDFDERFGDVGPSVVLASPGMLQNGMSRDLVERWAPNAVNTVILAGYSVEGTLAHELLRQPKMVWARLSEIIVTIASSLSSDHGSWRQQSQAQLQHCHGVLLRPRGLPAELRLYQATAPVARGGSERADACCVSPPHHTQVLVHGEHHEMTRFKAQVLEEFETEDRSVLISTPKNTKVIGRVQPTEGTRVKGLLVAKSFNYLVIPPEELPS